MTFRSLALSGIKGNWRAYNAFFLSSVFSVFVFYVYGSFIYHPDVINGHIKAAAGVRKGMEACQYIVVIFSFFFVLYANSAFLKTRKKEFGLFTLFGMTRGQLKRMIIMESAVIAVLAIAVGIGVGILFSKLFFMALALLLNVDNPIRFIVPLKAVLITSIGYFTLFLFLSALTSIRVGRSEIVDLLKEASKPKKIPASSPWLSLLAVISLASGYALAWNMNMYNFLIFALPILGLVTLGSYFLFTQSSIGLLRLVQKNKPFYFKRTHLITFSQMAFKVKDNARILFMVSLLSAIVLTASGTFYVFQQSGKAQLTSHFPQTIGFYEKGLDQHEVIDPAKVRSIIEADNRKLAYELRTVGIPAELTEPAPEGGGAGSQVNLQAVIISASDYNRAASEKGYDSLSVNEGSAAMIYPYEEMRNNPVFKGEAIKAKVGGQWASYRLDESRFGAVMSPEGPFTYLLVVGDKRFAEVQRAVPKSSQHVMYGFEIADWETALPTVKKIEKEISLSGEAENQANTFRVEQYVNLQQTSALTLFIGLFVSLLFFIASGSMLYFKLFTEMKDDEAQFRSLTRIGMTAGEIRRIVASQVGMIFYVPLGLGILHTFFAMKSLSNLLNASTWVYASVVVGIYIVMQTIYFIVAYTAYMKRMLKAAV
ncbi:FtsX-like permease family protein [Paenibacillus mendelii]|uniref:FtsX-like permease family protein n=1 Tax=Paenibacillus mendelii TaxID=206163 RepID=A0ABV6JIP7_9BACL|nr:ABC transporter permease [Paenibacillus mendelii]MCQ6558710.1 ABC transporter permease [Paenibacillus mendelii]